LKEGIARTTLRKKAKVKMGENKMQRKTRSHVVNMASKELRASAHREQECREEQEVHQEEEMETTRMTMRA
jgi:hypothetical protein